MAPADNTKIDNNTPDSWFKRQLDRIDFLCFLRMCAMIMGLLLVSSAGLFIFQTCDHIETIKNKPASVDNLDKPRISHLQLAYDSLEYADIGAITRLSVEAAKGTKANSDTLRKYSAIASTQIKEFNKIYGNQQIIRKNEDYLNARFDSIAKVQETSLNDIRQEVNNDINRVNAWLAFWIAAMSILGVVIPIAMELRLARDEEKRLKASITEHSKKYKERFDSLDQKSSEHQKDLTRKVEASLSSIRNSLSDIKNEWNDIRNETKNQEHQLKEFLIINQLSQCTEYRLMDIFRDNTSYLRELWNNATDYFRLIVVQSFKKDSSFPDEPRMVLYYDKRQIMTQALINIYALISEELMTSKSDKLSSRKCMRIRDLISKVLGHIANNEVSHPDLYNNIKEISKTISAIKI